MHSCLVFQVFFKSLKKTKAVSQPVNQSVGQWMLDLICTSFGMSPSSPFRGTQMGWGSGDQSKELSVCWTDSSAEPRALYQAPTATPATRQSPQKSASKQSLHTFNKWLKPLNTCQECCGCLPSIVLHQSGWSVNTDHNDFLWYTNKNGLFQLWISICGCEQITPASRFASLGCNSLKLAKIVVRFDTKIFLFFVTVVSVCSIYIRFCQNTVCIVPLHDVSHE